MHYKLGLTISIIIGILVAIFPLYADSISGYLWSKDSTGTRGSCHSLDNTFSDESEMTYIIQGTIEKVDLDRSILIVNGTEIRVLGTWITPSGTEINSLSLLELIRPGDQVTAICSHRGKWGYKLEEITVISTEEHYVKTS